MAVAAVAAAVGLDVDLLGLWEKLRPPGVVIEDLRVQQDGVVELNLRNYATDEELGTIKAPTTRVIATLNNREDASAAFYSVEARVENAVLLNNCQMGGDAIEVTGEYDLDLPLPEQEEEVVRSLTPPWQVAGLGNDSLAMSLGQQAVYGSASLPLYELRLRLHGGWVSRVTSESFLMANEMPHYSSFFGAWQESHVRGSDCPARNRATFKEFLSREGAISRELAAYLELLDLDPERLRPDGCASSAPVHIYDLHPVDFDSEDPALNVVTAVRCGDPGEVVLSLAVHSADNVGSEPVFFQTSLPADGVDFRFVEGALVMQYVSDDVVNGELLWIEETMKWESPSLTSIDLEITPLQ